MKAAGGLNRGRIRNHFTPREFLTNRSWNSKKEARMSIQSMLPPKRVRFGLGGQEKEDVKTFPTALFHKREPIWKNRVRGQYMHLGRLGNHLPGVDNRNSDIGPTKFNEA